MHQIKTSKGKDVIYGSKMGIDGMSMELTLCPKGWQPDFEGFVDCFCEITKPDHIKSITLPLLCI